MKSFRQQLVVGVVVACILGVPSWLLWLSNALGGQTKLATFFNSLPPLLGYSLGVGVGIAFVHILILLGLFGLDYWRKPQAKEILPQRDVGFFLEYDKETGEHQIKTSSGEASIFSDDKKLQVVFASPPSDSVLHQSSGSQLDEK